jgi:hypothetical protein
MSVLIVTIGAVLIEDGKKMKKVGVVVLSGLLAMSCCFGMEDSYTFSCQYHGTLVKVIRGYRGAIYQEDGKVDIIVVGQNEQKQLNRTASFGGDNSIASVSERKWNRVDIMIKECDSSSDEDHDNPTQWIKQRDYNFITKKMSSCILAVLEPCVDNPQYGKKRENCFYNNDQGEEAIAKALKHLALCYNNVLNKGIETLGTKSDKSIALPAFSTTFCLPRRDAGSTALETISGYIENNEKNDEKRYKKIVLYVKKRSDFLQYTEFFNKTFTLQ